jgi:hypothetical protein
VSSDVRLFRRLFIWSNLCPYETEDIGHWKLLTVPEFTADTPEEAREWVKRYAAAGARQIKIYSSVKPDIVKAIAAAAHPKGLTVTGHIPEGMTTIEAIHDGMDQINHIQYELDYSTETIPGADGKPDLSKPPVLELDGPRMKDLISLYSKCSSTPVRWMKSSPKSNASRRNCMKH